MSALLGDDAVTAGLGTLTGWARDGDSIVRTVELVDFPQAIEVVDRVAELAESADHHPDIDIRWRTLTFRCSTHSDGGITAKDLDLAAGIDSIVTRIG
jgi:4a-hydroxytetrahydrobiopterin dehydratase